MDIFVPNKKLWIPDSVLNDEQYSPPARSRMHQRNQRYSLSLMSDRGLMGAASGGDTGADSTSYALQGSNDGLRCADHADWTPSGDFTLECWFRMDSTSGEARLFHFRTDGEYYWYVDRVASSLLWVIAESDLMQIFYSGSVTWNTGQWYHIALIRGWGDGADDWALTIDGGNTGTGSYAGSMPNFTDGLYLGGSAYASDLNGNMDEIRISHTARYTANFTPPTEAFQSDANTKLLIHSGETIASGTTGSGATFTDSGNTGHTVTEFGGAIRDTTTYKF